MSAFDNNAGSGMVAGMEFGASPERGSSTSVWLLTFTDLVLLLLTFFILLFAMSDVDIGRFGALSRSADESGGAQLLDLQREDVPELTIPQRQVYPGGELGYLRAVVGQALSEDDRFGLVSTRLTNEYLVISIPAALLFFPGASSLTDQAEDAVFDLAPVLDALDNELAVVGHVGPAGPGAGNFVSSWELSLARAMALAEGLRSYGVRTSIAVLGRADIDYTERAQDMPALAQAALAVAADRVDILIFPHKSDEDM